MTKYGIVSTYSVTFVSQKILACLQWTNCNNWMLMESAVQFSEFSDWSSQTFLISWLLWLLWMLWLTVILLSILGMFWPPYLLVLLYWLMFSRFFSMQEGYPTNRIIFEDDVSDSYAVYLVILIHTNMTISQTNMLHTSDKSLWADDIQILYRTICVILESIHKDDHLYMSTMNLHWRHNKLFS